MSVTVHVILNAHLDPSWLWPWQAGIDEALATCRSACDRLDAHPEAVFTRGEAWVYRQIELCDPALFDRIRALVEEGRWSVVGGWWIQPDCNGPSAWAMDRQVELGLSYLEDAFGVRPRTAYNVDTFGHAAHLPSLMRAHGQDRYVMMRPQEHEKELPARVFRWRGYADGPEVTVFRIAGAYCAQIPTVEHIQKALTELPDGCRHTMCFVGIGDHGGGPTEETIARLTELKDAIPDVRLEYSSPDRLFDAIEADGVRLPVVVGELQHHAVGCYSVCHNLKVGVRRAEHLLAQTGSLDPKPDTRKAWEQVAFAHFHDIYGGTCVPSAYPQIEDQLGYARCTADTELQTALRRRAAELPDDPEQRVVLMNPSERPWRGYAEFEPWLDWRGSLHRSTGSYVLVDEEGNSVPTQTMPAEAAFSGMPRLLFPVALGAGELRVLRLRRGAETPTALSAVEELTAPKLQLIPDSTDTWSHRVDRFLDGPVTEPVWEDPQPVDRGPIMASIIRKGRIGDSRVTAEWRAYAGEPYVELLLTVFWAEERKLLKLMLPGPAGQSRVDGVMGGELERANDGAERPLRDFTAYGEWRVVCPDVFALDATPDRARLTLLRSPIMAHHLPHDGSSPRAAVSDQGEHRFRFRYFAPGTPVERLDEDAAMWQRPPLIGDLTRGMRP